MNRLILIILVFITTNTFAITEEEFCLNSAQTAVYAARQFYDGKNHDINSARRIHNLIISSDMKKLEKISGKLGHGEMLIMKNIDNYTKFGICEALKKRSDLNLIKLNAYNTCKDLLKRDFQIGTCLD